MWNHEDFSSITIISDGPGKFISLLGTFQLDNEDLYQELDLPILH